MSKKFTKAVEDYLASRGAKRKTGLYQYELETKAGPLLISLHEGDKAVFCRFKDVERAKDVLENACARYRLNQYSGKWNFNYPKRAPLEDCLRDFRDELEYVLPPDVEPLIRMEFRDACTLSVEEFEQLQREVVADAKADDRVSTRVLAQLVREHRGQYLECKKAIKRS